MSVLDYTNQLINEGLIFSDKTISIGLDEFESGKKDKLFVMGLSGTGKTTLGKHLAKKYNVKFIDLDYFKGNSNTLITSPERQVIVGIGGRDSLLNSPIIFLGKAFLKSIIDATIRDKKLSRIKHKFIKNYGRIASFNKFKEERLKAGGDVQEFKVPKL
jgi:hypothetical protein